MFRPVDPQNPVVVVEKVAQVQTVGTVKRTLGKISVNMNPEEQFKSKVEFTLKYGTTFAKIPLQMNFGIRAMNVNEQLSDLANVNKWFDVVEKTKKTMNAYAQRILECYDTSTSRKIAEEYINYSYTVACRTRIRDISEFKGEKYSIEVGDTTRHYYDTNPLEDNNNDLLATSTDMTDKLYNFVAALFGKLGEHIEINGTVEGYMFNGYGKEYKDKKTELLVQSLNPVMTPDSFLLPTKSKTNDKIYYNSNYDCQFVFQNQPHVTENEVGMMQGLVENPDKYQLKCKIKTKSNVELSSEKVSESEAGQYEKDVDTLMKEPDQHFAPDGTPIPF